MRLEIWAIGGEVALVFKLSPDCEECNCREIDARSYIIALQSRCSKTTVHREVVCM